MGMFDTILFKCPRCGFTIKDQSKGGKCQLLNYRSDRVPLGTAAYALGDKVECGRCGSPFIVTTNTRRVTLLLRDYNVSTDQE